jgi:hypothetical protein
MRRMEMSGKIEDWAMARESIREELDAINRYEERIAQTSNVSLKKVLQHNADEEKEHVAMLVEWLRQNDRTQDKVFEEHD